MNGFKYKSILYFISAVILATLCIQVYWNYKNYQVGKQQLANDVQTSLDNAIDQYYTELATEGTFRVFGDTLRLPISPIKKRGVFLTDTCFNNFQTNNPSLKEVTILQSGKLDSLDFNITIFDSVRMENRGN